MNYASDTITATKRWVCIRWACFGGYYFVGPFADAHEAADWGDENQGTNVCWHAAYLDPNVALEVRAPGAMPELAPDPEAPDKWTERLDCSGDFYLLMTASDPLHLVGPFSEHRHAFSWAVSYQARTDDEEWWVLWLDDAAAPPPLLTRAEDVEEVALSDLEFRTDPDIVAILGTLPDDFEVIDTPDRARSRGPDFRYWRPLSNRRDGAPNSHARPHGAAQDALAAAGL